MFDAFQPRPIDIRRADVAEAVLSLQKVSYPIEAKLIGLDEIPPMRDTVSTLMTCGETFLGVFDAEERLVGALSFKLPDEGRTLDIYRMMVHPDCFRRGIASRLLEAALAAPGIERALVSTGTANTPAVQLYLRHGFAPTGLVDIAPNVTITKFEKSI